MTIMTIMAIIIIQNVNNGICLSCLCKDVLHIKESVNSQYFKDDDDDDDDDDNGSNNHLGYL